MSNTFGKWVRIGAAVLVIGMLNLPTAWARWMHGINMPVARLLKNVGDYVAAHPKDPQGYYTLGRINSAAFALDTETIPAYIHGPLPDMTSHTELTYPKRNKTKPLSPRAEAYLLEAIGNYKKAVELDPGNGLSWFGLGFQCEESLPFPTTREKMSAALALSGPPETEKIRQAALQNYRKAYTLTVKTDANKPRGLTDPVSIEAAQGIIRLQEKHELSAAEKTELTELQERVTAFLKRGRPVTPILISFERQASLSDLLCPEKHVRFDLAGDGLGRQWPWVKPTTGILVWDPQHTGKITSGLQLFGSVTWWLFWKDGYGPLAALDNNHNGWLEGVELKGIAVWFDRNSNGIADKGEVVSLSSCGVKRIAAHATGVADGVPANPEGVQLRDGSSVATFDWTTTSLTK